MGRNDAENHGRHQHSYQTSCSRQPALGRPGTKALREADLVAVPITVLCEFVWLLRRGYKKTVSEASVEAGLSVLDAGRDFSDGVINQQDDWLCGERICFLRPKAVSVLQSQGIRARLLS